jgi:hypothetical protein
VYIKNKKVTGEKVSVSTIKVKGFHPFVTTPTRVVTQRGLKVVTRERKRPKKPSKQQFGAALKNANNCNIYRRGVGRRAGIKGENETGVLS